MPKIQQFDMFNDTLEHRMTLAEKRIARAHREIAWLKEIFLRTRPCAEPRKNVKFEQITMWGT